MPSMTQAEPNVLHVIFQNMIKYKTQRNMKSAAYIMKYQSGSIGSKIMRTEQISQEKQREKKKSKRNKDQTAPHGEIYHNYLN